MTSFLYFDDTFLLLVLMNQINFLKYFVAQILQATFISDTLLLHTYFFLLRSQNFYEVVHFKLHSNIILVDLNIYD